MNKTLLKPGLYLIPLTTLINQLECVAVTLIEVPADLPFVFTASEANAFAAYSYQSGQLETFSIGRPTFESEPGLLVYPDDIEAMPVDAASLSDAVRDAMRGVTYSALHLSTCRNEVEEYLKAFDAENDEDDEE